MHETVQRPGPTLQMIHIQIFPLEHKSNQSDRDAEAESHRPNWLAIMPTSLQQS